VEYIIETFELTKQFNHTLAIENVNLKVKQGELFCLVGPNGAGKTTLLKVLSTLILPTLGKAKVNGYDIIKNPTQVKKCIGLVSSEERSFYWRLTGRQNLEFYSSLYDLPSKDAKQRINEILSLLKLEEQSENKFQNYSAGVKQKINIARALLHNPPILLIDELTKSLDPITAENLRKFIKEKLVKELKKTVILATHNLKEAEIIADYIAVIDLGKIIVQGTVNELKEQTQTTDLEEAYSRMITCSPR